MLPDQREEECRGTNIFSDNRGQLEKYSLDELYTFLAKLLEKEDYENATVIRDTIAKKE